MRITLLAILWLWCCPPVGSTQVDPGSDPTDSPTAVLTLRALGTGQTTGHIADLVVQSTSSKTISTTAQSCFIPARDGFQSYVARIPAGITLPAGGSVTLPLIGYCTDVSTPPVPAGRSLPPVSEWVPVASSETAALGNNGATPVLSGTPQAAFRVELAGYLRTLLAFTKSTSSKTDAPQLLYPATDLLLGGTYAVNDAPLPVAALIVAVVQEIETVVKIRQEAGTLLTPFTGSPLREREAVVQQTVWIYMATLTGNSYTQADFARKISDQHQHHTGTLPESLPAAQKTKLETGIAQFWQAFLTTGTAAQVFQP